MTRERQDMGMSLRTPPIRVPFDRGVLAYVEHQDGLRGAFPVTAEVV